MVVAQGKMQELRAAHLSDVPPGGTSDGAFAQGCYLEFAITQATVKWLFFICLIIILTVTDLRVRLLPDVITWPGFAAGLLFSAFVPLFTSFPLLSLRFFHQLPPERVLGVIEALLGAAFGSLFALGAAALYKLVRGREGMGLGDVKMMLIAGAFLGVRNAFLTILPGDVLLGSIVGVAVIAMMYAGGAGRQLAERPSRRGMGAVNQIRWAIASQYHLPLGTSLWGLRR